MFSGFGTICSLLSGIWIGYFMYNLQKPGKYGMSSDSLEPSDSEAFMDLKNKIHDVLENEHYDTRKVKIIISDVWAVRPDDRIDGDSYLSVPRGLITTHMPMYHEIAHILNNDVKKFEESYYRTLNIGIFFISSLTTFFTKKSFDCQHFGIAMCCYIPIFCSLVLLFPMLKIISNIKVKKSEKEADLLGLRLAFKQNEGKEYVDYFRGIDDLHKKYGINVSKFKYFFLSTHPTPKERVEYLQSSLNNLEDHLKKL